MLSCVAMSLLVYQILCLVASAVSTAPDWLSLAEQREVATPTRLDGVGIVGDALGNVENPGGVAMGELGELLRSTREAKGISLAQAEQATKIRRQYLEALEEEDFELLPGEVYVRGFLRNYARFLGLAPEEVLKLRGAPPEEPITTPFGTPLEEPLVTSSSSQLVLKFFAVLLSLAAIAAATWWGYQWHTGESLLSLLTPAPTSTPTLRPTTAVAPTETATPTVVTPQPTASPLPTYTPVPPTATLSPTATPAVGLQITMDVVERTWLEVTVDGELVLGETVEAGNRLSWTATESISCHCGNAGGVRVTVAGEEIGALGDPGQVVDRVWTTP